MNQKTVDEAVKAAQRFLARAQELSTEEREFPRLHEHGYGTGTKATGALRRSSMDLTRALATMRRHT